jgi:hypothetical protein
MKKIWVVRGNICKNENKFLREISYCGDNVKYQVFTVSEEGTAGDIKKQLEADQASADRELQLKAVLDELTQKDKNLLGKKRHIPEFIDLYDKMYPDPEKNKNGYYGSNTKPNILRVLKSLENKPKEFSKFIVERKKYFLTFSDDVEWYKALLRCHKFINCTEMKYDYRARCKVDKIELPEKNKESFKQAKLELKKK